MPGSTYRSRFVFLFWLQMIIRHPPGKFSPCFLHLLMAQVASNKFWEENWAKVLLVLRYEGRRTKQDSDQACFKHKTSIPDQHRLFLDNFLLIKYFYQLWNSQELFSCFISYPMILLSALKVCQETQLFKLFPIRKENLRTMFPFKLYIWGKVN